MYFAAQQPLRFLSASLSHNYMGFFKNVHTYCNIDNWFLRVQNSELEFRIEGTVQYKLWKPVKY